MPNQWNGGSSHFCQIHHDDRELSEGLARFAEAGINNGQAVVIVASNERIHCLQRSLADSGVSPDSLSGLLITIESRALLETFMRQGSPEKALFFEALRPALRNAVLIGAGFPRIYGEMVNDLWQGGNPDAAIALEHLWNELLEEYKCSLFCGYVLDAFDLDSYKAELEGVCTSHSDLAPTMSDERVRLAIDEACMRVLGIHLSSVLSHSQLGHDDWHVRLEPARRAILWLKRNTPSRLGQVLGLAREFYDKGEQGMPLPQSPGR